MRYKIVSLLIILGAVGGLCGIVAIPTTADSPTAIQGLSVTPAPDDANQPAAYTVTFTISNSGTLAAGVGFIYITFPSETQLPSSISMANVSVNGTVCSSGTISANTLSIVVPEDILPGSECSVLINQLAGIKNPELSQETGDGAPDNLYETTVSTSSDTAGVTDDYEIFDWIITDRTAFSFGEMVTVTGAGFDPGSTVTLNSLDGGPLAGSGTVEADGTFEILGIATGGLMDDLEASDGSGRIASIPASEFTILPRIDISPSQGPICTEITISGWDFVGTPSAITIGGVQLVAPGSLPQELVDLDNDDQLDDFELSGVTVPRTLDSGPNDIYVWSPVIIEGTEVLIATSDTFDVDSRTVAVDPASGPPGTMVTIQGSGLCKYDSNGMAIIMYGNTTASGSVTAEANIEVDDQGNFTAVGAIPEDAPEGLHGILVFFNDGPPTFDACVTGTNCVIAQGMFTVTERELTVVPESGPFGVSITVSGGNFGEAAGGLTPDLYVNYEDVPPELEPLSSSGQMVPETFEVTPERNFHYGGNIIEVHVYVAGSGTRTAVCAFDVIRPTLLLDKDQGPRGTLVTASGSGWLPEDTGFVSIGYEAVPDRGVEADTVAVVQPDPAGDIDAQFNIPAFSGSVMAAGDLPLLFSAHDTNGNTSLQSTFTVTGPEISVYPEYGAGGDSITVTGIGFLPLAQVQEVSMAGTPIVPVYELPLTSGTGSFSITGTVPGLMPGGYLIEARVTQPVGDPVTCPFTVLSGSPGEITVEEGLAAIEGYYTTLWTYDSGSHQWLVYKPGLPPWISILFDTLVTGRGYWIRVTQDCTLTYGAHTYELVEGWNLIGWMG